MKQIQEKHRRAMELDDEAFLARRNGDTALTAEKLQQALEYEREAANLTSLEEEPSRSVLYRSAATLAFDCGEFREAERLVATALAGNPPDEIADELRELLEQVYRIWGNKKQTVPAA